MFNSRIYRYNKKIYLKFQRDETFHVRMWTERSQRDCVIISKKFNEMIFSSSSIFVQFRAIFQIAFLIVSQFDFKSAAFAEKNVNTINIKNEIVKKLFTNEKYNFKIIIINQIVRKFIRSLCSYVKNSIYENCNGISQRSRCSVFSWNV